MTAEDVFRRLIDAVGRGADQLTEHCTAIGGRAGFDVTPRNIRVHITSDIESRDYQGPPRSET